MDYEKKYKEALERAKNLHKDAIDMEESLLAKQCEIIFPELKESEDERIRKAIHIYLDWLDGRRDYQPKGDYTIKDMITWLGKQGEIDKESYKIDEKEKREFVGDGFIKCYADFQDFKEGETYWLEYIGDDKYNVRSDNLLGKTYHITPCQLYTVFKKLTWLEKQGSQEESQVYETEDGKTITYSETDGYKVIEPDDLIEESYQQQADDLIDMVTEKPAWSEEDSKRLQRIIDFLWYNRKGDTDTIYQQEQDIEWLKSLKNRLQK